MCGIVGLYLKNPELESQLGALFAPMLIAMTGRGPDSAGFAIYGDEVPEGSVKLTLQHNRENYPWDELSAELEKIYDTSVSVRRNANAAVLKLEADEQAVRGYLGEHQPDINIMSVGRSVEILKAVGLPEHIVSQYNLEGMQGTHIIGHTRMATESAVTTEGSHPFSTGMDLCLVHNGSFSNHNRLREELRRRGFQFQTENDTEVAAAYLTWRLQLGESLEEALNSALKDLDGFYTLTIGTRDGFAVLRDPIACKPATMAETDDYVAIASEYQSLSQLPGIDQARLWEPEPAIVYTWGGAVA
ncbi:MAG: glutamate synthase domain-containing protein 1 [Halieaceae bacterium]|jgi:glutamate synthase domain-containing protein 1